MRSSLLVHAAVGLHYGFVAFVVAGGFLSLRWRRLIYPHVAALVWGLGILTVGQACPLTALLFRQRSNRTAKQPAPAL